MILPGILPRLRDLLFSGYGYLAYYIALVYGLVRLLPVNHPYLNPENIGRYGLRHVIATAAANLTFSRRHIDQILIFTLILTGVVLLFVYIAATIFFLLVSPAFAGPLGGILGLFGDTPFTTRNPYDDVAFKMLDRTFGLPGVFNSSVADGSMGPWPTAYHAGVQNLFRFYSLGLFFIAIFVFLYHILTVVYETTQSGKPFTKFYENPWAPIRLVAGLGLLIPFGVGLNSGQWIALYAAKLGSGVATNTWIKFNEWSGENPMGGTNANIVARPNAPGYTGLIKQLILIRTCMQAYELALPGSASGSIIGGSGSESLTKIRPYAIKGETPIDVYEAMQTGSSFDLHKQLMEYYKNKDIVLTFGEEKDDYTSSPGRVFPYCGKITIPTPSLRPEALFVQEGYLYGILSFIYPGYQKSGGFAGGSGGSAAGVQRERYCVDRRPFDVYGSNAITGARHCACDTDPPNSPGSGYDNGAGSGDLTILGRCDQMVSRPYWTTSVDRQQEVLGAGVMAGYQYLTGALNIGSETKGLYSETYYKSISGQYAAWLNAVTQSDTQNPMGVTTDILRLGWGGAGVWYNKIAEMNGAMMAAVQAMPSLSAMPSVMVDTSKQRQKQNKGGSAGSCSAYNPSVAGGDSMAAVMPGKDDTGLARVLYHTCSYLFADADIAPTNKTQQAALTGNPIVDMLTGLLGVKPLLNFRENSQVNPLAQLTVIGRGLINNAIQNFTGSVAIGAFGGMAAILDGGREDGATPTADGLGLLSKMGVTFSFMAISAGIVLYYIVPMMPFMYFFFSVGRWVKTIFEAMVGVPLWALAHLSMEGNGLPGKSASNGYFLMLEIFIRPTLSVFGLIASVATFGASVMILNVIFDLATANMLGYDPNAIASGNTLSVDNLRGKLDQFFFLIMYVIIVYMTATSAFKMIDLLPDNIMRWSGMGVQTFAPGDNADEMVDNVAMKSSFAISMQGTQLAQSAGETVHEITKEMFRPPPTPKQKPPPPEGGQQQ